MRSRIISAFTTLILVVPLVAHAQEGIQRIVNFATDIINFALAILIGIAIATFFWGLVKYLFGAKGGPEQTKASTIMMSKIHKRKFFFLLSFMCVVMSM